MGRYIIFVIVCLLLSGHHQMANSGDSSADVSLYKTLFFNQIPEYSPAKLNVTEYHKEHHARLFEYIARWRNFKSKIAAPHGPWEQKVVVEKKIQVERGIVSLIKTKDVEDLAATYASGASISMEWEGMSDGPLGEAGAVEHFLDGNPQSPLKPYLILFLLHRYRIAFECLGFEKKPEKEAMASNKYQEYLNMAKAEKDSLIGLIATDIDKQKYLYIKTEKHP